MISKSLWTQSIAALFWGLLLSISIMLNLNKLMPLATDTRLFVGLLVGFCTWAAVITFCLSRNDAKQAARACGLWLLISVLVNVVMYVLWGLL